MFHISFIYINKNIISLVFLGFISLGCIGFFRLKSEQ
jgi:hypothetical protein